MDKRGFLTVLGGDAAPSEKQTAAKASAARAAGADAGFARFANAVLPKRAAIAAGVEPYAGPWTRTQAMHLLRRALFGFTQADLDKALSLTASGCVDALLTLPEEAPSPPLTVNATNDPTVPVGTTWVNAPHDGDANFERSRTLKSWWLGLLLNQGFSVREKMTFFWHNHFATDLDDVGIALYSYRENALHRANALGNFKALVKAVTLAPAMLRYLNGNTNTKSNPNENYARELQELFTIGKGPEIAPGNYTHYTEDDVKAAARVLTGWRDLRDTLSVEFRPTAHDTSNKTFSSAYGGTVITGRTGADGALELDDLLDMIFAQAETALHICRKLYRHFVYYVIDDATEKDVIAPMAELLRAGNWEIKPVVSLLLKSAHFFAAANMGCAIKTPLDTVIGTFRSLGAAIPGEGDPVKQYAIWRNLASQAASMQLDLLQPPNVAGWPAYYQDPVYYQSWISSDTLPKRIQFTDRVSSTRGYAVGSDYLTVDVVALAERTSEPGDLAVLIPELSDLLYPFPLTAKQHEYLKGILLDGSPTYEWGDEWAEYAAAPTDAAKRSVVEKRLRSLLKSMMALAEYQLC